MAVILTGRTHQELLSQAVDLVEATGEKVDPDLSESNLGKFEYQEVNNVILQLEDAKARVVSAPDFDLGRAILRSLWILAGADDIDGLKPLFHSVDRFSDDGSTLTGSAVGARLLSHRQKNGDAPQIEGIMDRLRYYPTTRRATAVIYEPRDATRHSVDIPCLLSLTWQRRDDRLQCTSVMRANNVIRLLPYNIFEYTMLAECIASELNINVGTHHHHAISMHAYEPDFGRLQDVRNEIATSAAPQSMRPMPREEGAIEMAGRAYTYLVEFLSRIDHANRQKSLDVIHEARGELDDYWYSLVHEVAKASARSRRSQPLEDSLTRDSLVPTNGAFS